MGVLKTSLLSRYFAARTVPNFLGGRTALQLKRPTVLNLTGREAISYVKSGGLRAGLEILSEASPYLCMGLIGFSGSLGTNVVHGFALATTKKTSSAEIIISNRAGLHARVAGRLVKIAREHNCEIWVEFEGVSSEKNDVLNICGMNAKHGSAVRIFCFGQRAEEVIKAILDLAEKKFLEDEFDPARAKPVESTVPDASLMPKAAQDEVVLSGTSIIKGITVSRAITFTRDSVVDKVPARTVSEEEIDAKIEDAGKAFTKLADFLNDQIASARAENRAKTVELFETFRLSLSGLRKEITRIMKEGLVNARGAFDRYIEENLSKLKNSEDPDDQARYYNFEELRDVFLRIRYNLPGTAFRDVVGEGSAIIIARSLEPLEASVLLSKYGNRVAGIGIEKGRETMHIGMVLKDRGVVSVIGIPGLAETVKDGDLLILDGVRGEVVVNPSEATQKKYVKFMADFEVAKRVLVSSREKEIVTLDGEKIFFGGNIENADEARALFEVKPNEGARLIRTEFFYMNDTNGRAREEAPGLDEQISYYRAMIREANGQPETIRTFDVGTGSRDKKLPYYTNPKPIDLFTLEPKGIDLYIDEQNNRPTHLLFKEQIKAILIAATEERAEVNVIFPLVKNLHEYYKALKICRDVVKELKDDGIKVTNKIKFGMMLETPNIIEEMERIKNNRLEARDFEKNKPQVLNVGSNDLTEITLGAGREDPNYDELRKAPLGYLERIIEISRSVGVPACLCGDVANKFPDLLVMLGMGFTHFSVPSKTLDALRYLVQSIRIEDCRGMFRDIKEMETPQEARKYLKARVKELVRSGQWPLSQEVIEVYFREILT